MPKLPVLLTSYAISNLLDNLKENLSVAIGAGLV